jgi:hypothetical protein
MAERVTSFISIIDITKQFMNQRKEKSLANFEGYVQSAIEIYSDINIFDNNNIQVAYISVNPDTNTAILPVDFISYTKIGFRKNGRLYTLTMNNDIALPPESSICSVDIDDITETTETNGGYYFAPHYRYGAYIDTLYGMGGGFNIAYYRIDMTNRTIVFKGRVPENEIVLEYISSGVTSGTILVPRQAVPSVIAGLHWKTIEYDSRFGVGDKQRKEQLYYAERRKLVSLNCSFTMSELMDALYEGYAQSPKR